MKKIFVFSTLIIFGFILLINHSTANQKPKLSSEKTGIIITGTIHKKNHTNPKYKPEKLKEIILSLKPDVVLNELPLSHVEPNGRPIGRQYEKHPEGWAADSAAQKLGIEQIPFDRPNRNEHYKKTNYFKKQDRSNQLIKQWGQALEKNEPNLIDLQLLQLWQHVGTAEHHLIMTATPEVINSEAHDSIIRAKKSLWYDIMPKILEKYPKYKIIIEDYHFSRDEWNDRNQIMVENILKAAKKYPGKRLVVVTGCTHRYILRDLLKNEKSIELKEFWKIEK